MTLSSEDKILNSASKVFIIYGYYGATITKIAKEAGVSKTAIHYYYRSKVKLFEKVVPGMIIDLSNPWVDKEYRFKIFIFFLSEMNSNRENLMNLLRKIKREDWMYQLYNKTQDEFSCKSFCME